SVTGGIDNNAGGITETGAISGATNISASGVVTLSGASPLTFSHATPVITLGTAGVDSTLSVNDGDGNTLLSLTDNGTTGDLSVTGTINAAGGFLLNGTDINTA